MIVGLVEEMKARFCKLFEALEQEKYPKAGTYLENFYHQTLLVFEYWLEGMDSLDDQHDRDCA